MWFLRRHQIYRADKGVMPFNVSENLCLPEVQEFTPDKIVSIRKKSKLSQAALASIFNISPSTIQKWEQGNKKPAGASCKLLDILERKGLDAFI